jgi:hypothetical protein
VCRHWSRVLLRPRALAPVRVILSRSINACRPHPSHSQAHRDFAVYATYTRCLRCAAAPRRPTSGSELSLSVPSWHAALYVSGKIRIVFLQFTDSDMGLRQDLTGSALPTILPSASSRARISGLIDSPLLRPVRLLAPLDGSDRVLSRPRGLLHLGFQRVSHLYHYWTSLRQSLDSSVGGTFTHWKRQLALLHQIRTCRICCMRLPTSDVWRRSANFSFLCLGRRRSPVQIRAPRPLISCFQFNTSSYFCARSRTWVCQRFLLHDVAPSESRENKSRA